ncbi:MAG: MvdC/MvdD family ATP grasp protein, partial [bacterium]
MVDALRDRGAEPIVLDSSRFPDSAPLTLSYDRGEFRGRWSGDGDGDGDALSGITAVWQNTIVGTALPAMAPGVRETCVAASELALVGLLDNLDVFQLDPHARQ